MKYGKYSLFHIFPIFFHILIYMEKQKIVGDKIRQRKYGIEYDPNRDRWMMSDDVNKKYWKPVDWDKYHIVDGRYLRSDPDRRGGGCFIATAAYGTPFAEEINSLRYWRDEALLTNPPGTLFVKTYYTLSPPVADFIRDKPTLRKITRFLLAPVVKLAQIWQNKNKRNIQKNKLD